MATEPKTIPLAILKNWREVKKGSGSLPAPRSGYATTIPSPSPSPSPSPITCGSAWCRLYNISLSMDGEIIQQELSEANHRARRSAGEKLNISPLDIGHK